MLIKRSLLLATSALFTITSASAGAIVFSSSGANAAAIQATVDNFRAALGSLNPNVPGSFGSGRREINWDGVPDGFSAPNNLPAGFFNSNSPRGVVFSTPGTGFQVSANTGVAPIEFDNLNAGYSSIFQTFSAQRLFTPLGSNIMDVNFFVPGSGTASYTSAFGAVFTDVDLANTTSLQFFDFSNSLLGTFFVPTANNGLSFLGIQFNAGERVGRVRITTGSAALGGADSSTNDMVVMDDFIYAEPAAVPEPAAWTMMVLGAGFLAAMRRRFLARG